MHDAISVCALFHASYHLFLSLMTGEYKQMPLEYTMLPPLPSTFANVSVAYPDLKMIKPNNVKI